MLCFTAGSQLTLIDIKSEGKHIVRNSSVAQANVSKFQDNLNEQLG